MLVRQTIRKSHNDVSPLTPNRGGYIQKGTMKKIEEKLFDKLANSVAKDLTSFARKYNNYKIPEQYSYIKRYAFFMQIRDGMYNVMENGACLHTLNSMIKDAKQNVIEFQKSRLEDK